MRVAGGVHTLLSVWLDGYAARFTCIAAAAGRCLCALCHQQVAAAKSKGLQYMEQMASLYGALAMRGSLCK
jgi:hypothetical protein